MHNAYCTHLREVEGKRHWMELGDGPAIILQRSTEDSDVYSQGLSSTTVRNDPLKTNKDLLLVKARRTMAGEEGAMEARSVLSLVVANSHMALWLAAAVGRTQ